MFWLAVAWLVDERLIRPSVKTSSPSSTQHPRVHPSILSNSKYRIQSWIVIRKILLFGSYPLHYVLTSDWSSFYRFDHSLTLTNNLYRIVGSTCTAPDLAFYPYHSAPAPLTSIQSAFISLSCTMWLSCGFTLNSSPLRLHMHMPA